MWFVSKKKYKELECSRDAFKMLADRWKSHTENANKLADEWQDVAVSYQEDNKRLVALGEEMLAKITELETKLEWARQQEQQWADEFEELDIAYGQLEADHDRLHEEFDFVVKQRDYYRGLLEDTSEVEEEDE